MMRVVEQPAPDDFEDRVGKPGRAFLKKTKKPTTKQWATHDYWTRIKFDLHDAYKGVCNFVCHWIPRDTGAITVEHFKPKSRHPRKAYDWSNYRLMCGTLNGRKKDFQDVLDPFQIQNGWFVLEFPSLYVKPLKTLDASTKKKVQDTIDRLKLNDEGTCIKARERYLKYYCRNEVTFSYLEVEAPFIAAELKRQGLKEDIRTIMGYS